MTIKPPPFSTSSDAGIAAGSPGAPPGRPLGTAGEPGCLRMVSRVAEEVERDVNKSDHEEHEPSFLEALEARAVAQVAAGAPLPLDPEGTYADQLTFSAVEAHTEQVEITQRAVDLPRARFAEARELRAAVPPPMTRNKQLAAVAGIAALAGLAVAATARLTAPTTDVALLGNYLAAIFDEGEVYSAAYWASALLAAAVVVAQSVGMLISWGRGGPWAKALMLLADMFPPAAFLIARGDDVFAGPSLAVAGHELAILFAFTGALMWIGSALRDDGERQKRVTVADQLVALRLEELDAAERAHADAVEAFSNQLRVIEERDLGYRRSKLNEEAVKAECRAAYWTALSALISRKLGGSSKESTS